MAGIAYTGKTVCFAEHQKRFGLSLFMTLMGEATYPAVGPWHSDLCDNQ